MTEDPRWTLHELIDEVARVLRGYDPPANGKVRPVPDVRAVRYYTSLGLLDRPAEMRGRTALYGRRHLAQLVAIKRLQTAGRSLAEIQGLLPSLDDAALGRASGVEVPRRPAPGPARAGFWRQAAASAGAAPKAAARAEAPAAPPTAASSAASAASAASSAEPAPTAPSAAFGERLVLALAPGVTVVVDPVRAATGADADAALAAGAALVAELRRRHLVDPDDDR